MSEVATQVSESRSSAAITQNSKGEPSCSVKVYADSTDLDAIDAAVDKALEQYARLNAGLA